MVKFDSSQHHHQIPYQPGHGKSESTGKVNDSKERAIDGVLVKSSSASSYQSGKFRSHLITEKKQMGRHDKYGGSNDDDDDEEVEIKISPTGSVLSPSPNPYDKTQKLRQANAQLMASRLPPRPPGKVRFNESVIASDEPAGDSGTIRSKKPKTNVTLPPSLKKN